MSADKPQSTKTATSPELEATTSGDRHLNSPIEAAGSPFAPTDFKMSEHQSDSDSNNLNNDASADEESTYKPLMDNPIANVSTVIMTYCLLVLANGLLSTIFVVRGKIEGFSDAHIGLFGTAYFLGMLIGALNVKKLVIRLGYIRSFASFASIVSILALIPIMITYAPVWILARLLAGFFTSGLVLVVEGWINTRATNKNRGRIMGFYMLMNYGAMASGQLLLMSADPSGFKLFTLASILLSLAVIPLLVSHQTAPSLAEVIPVSLKQIIKISPLGVFTVFTSGLINATLFTLSPLLVTNIGFNTTQTSYFMAFLIMGGLAVQWPLGKLSDALDRRYLVLGVCIIGAVMVFLVTWLMQMLPNFAFIGAFFMGGILLTLYSIGTAHTHDYSKPGQAVQIASGLIIAFGVGATLGPTTAVFMSRYLGNFGIYYFIVFACIMLGSYALYRSTKRDSMPMEDRNSTNIFHNMAQPNFLRVRWAKHNMMGNEVENEAADEDLSDQTSEK